MYASLAGGGQAHCFSVQRPPRRASKVAVVLNKFGITEDLYDYTVSSGEAAYQLLKN